MPNVDRRQLIVGSLATAAFAMSNTPAQALVDPEAAGYIPVPGGRIWYRLNGLKHLTSGKAPLIVLHGGPGSSHRSRLPMLDLADERTVILYDQLDSGHADHPGDPSNWRLERFVAELAALRAHLELPHVCVLGHSWGGTIAAAYAAQRPEGLRALILSSPLISTSRWVKDNAAYVAALPPRVRQAIAKHEAAGSVDSPEYQAAVEVYNKRHLCRANPCPIGDTGKDAPAYNTVLYRAMWGPSEFTATGSLKDLNLTSSLSKIAAPTLFICGAYDEATPAACQDFAKVTPKATFIEVPEAGHSTMFEQRAFYMASVRKFLTQAGG